jgi:hypothetical protein
MHLLLAVYAMRLRAVRNTLQRGGVRMLAGWLLVLGAVAVVEVVIFTLAPRSLQLAGTALSGGSSHALAFQALFTALISFFNLSFAMLFLASFPLTLGTYTYRSDLALLLPAPIPPRVVFAEKLLTGILRQYVLVIPLMGPYLFGLGYGLHLSVGFFLLSVLILLLMPVGPTCLGGILTFLFLTLFPPARAKTLVTVGGATIGSLFYLSQEILWSGRARVSIDGASGVLRGIQQQWLAQLPPSWPASGLVLAAHRQILVALGYGLGFGAVGLSCLALAVLTAIRTFSSGWANYQEATKLTPPVLIGETTPAIRLLRRPFWHLSPLVPKEWLLFARDPQQWAALIMPLGVSVYFSYMLIFRYGSANLPAGLRFMLAIAGVNFLVSSLVAPLSLTIVNREQRTFILLRTWPVSTAVILRDKFLAVYLPLTLLFELLMAIIAVGDRLSLGLAVLGALGTALTCAMLIAWSMALSLLFPRLDWTNITQMTTWQAWLLSFIGGSTLGILVAALLAAGPVAATTAHPLAVYAPYLTVAGCSSCALIAAAIGVWLFGWGPHKLARIEIR